ncbi:glyoxalase [[Phormidium ambiguum] IAM M-71]|uniref:Glyoxalase n=1 Tax=[Phormidium ambiguum] IAM M-71 TaxID=454136 RepID=A0A1U7I8P1_9CYAN|nr:glyoxalase [Phormidium ambiguum]OKH32855.1 glyoxalase [Phormidium ambiguum IAM M-71]
MIDAFVTLGVVEFDKVIDFYSKFLNQEPQRFIPNFYGEFRFPGGLRLGIFQPKAEHFSEFSNSHQSGMSLCLEVENLESAIDLLIAIGYPPSGEITLASHGREIYAYDPAGNRLILHQSVKSSQLDSP